MAKAGYSGTTRAWAEDGVGIRGGDRPWAISLMEYAENAIVIEGRN